MLLSIRYISTVWLLCYICKSKNSRICKQRQSTLSIHYQPPHTGAGGGEEGWLRGAKVLGKLIWLIVGQEPTALAVGAGGGCLDIFTLIYIFSPLSPTLWETARYRLKYCLKGPLNPTQPTNQPSLIRI